MVWTVYLTKIHNSISSLTSLLMFRSPRRGKTDLSEPPQVGALRHQGSDYFRAEASGIPCAPEGCVSPNLAARVAAKSMGWHGVA